MLTRLAHGSATLALLGMGSALVLAGCGSSSSDTGATHRFSSGGPSEFGISAAQQRKIRSCLEAAGLASAVPTGRPSGVPSGGPSGAPPSGAPTGELSTGAPQDGPFGDPEVRAALKACGITLPSTPTGAPTGG